jgi:Solitary outer membrane autotransporter beta-barrel domain
MTTKGSLCLSSMSLRIGMMVGMGTSLLMATPASAALTPAEINDFRNTIGNRVEAVTILGGDYGIGGGSYFSSGGNNHVNINVTKFGGAGDVGAPQPLGNLGIGWQPRLQGSMGYLTAKNNFQSGLLDGDTSEYKTFAIQFGGGARFWFDDHFSIAPTVMGMYGHTENTYTARSAFALANLPEAKQLGLIDWDVDTWTIRPSLNLQYEYTWHRIIFTFSSEPTYFYTESFSSSSPNLNINGDSEAWANKIDVDVPLGVELFGHELRTGGYFSRTDLYGDLQDGLNTSYVYEIHGRLVLDFLDELWKVKWIGLGGSYLWGDNIHGWSIGADVAFRF